MSETIVRTFSGLVHKHLCYAVPKGTMKRMDGSRVMKFTVLGTVDDGEAFVRARGLNPCGACWPGLRDKIEAEKLAEA